MLTRDMILQASDLSRQAVDIPEWGGSAFIYEMTGTELDGYQSSLMDGSGTVTPAKLIDARARLVAICLRNNDGNRLFTDTDVAALGRKNGRILDRLWKVARDLNAMGDEAIGDARGK